MFRTRVFMFFLALLFAGSVAVANPDSDQARVYKVEGMTCALCKKAIQKSLGKVEGVNSVDVDRAAELVTVTASPTIDPDILKHAIESAGPFTATPLEAP